jgi:indole-3-glycerol phosphate synthase
MATKELEPQVETIIAAKRQYLKERMSKTPIEAVRALASMQKRPHPVLNTVSQDSPIMIIGQIKYRLPQTGKLGQSYDPVGLAVRFAQAGLDAVALFTDATIYDGGLDDLVLVSRAVNIPVISQDYILEEYQIVEVRAAGVSALLLSATVLEPAQLRSLVSATHRNRMTAIVQVHDEEELQHALSLSPYVIGLSSYNPHTDTYDPTLIARLRALIPSHIRVMVTDALKTLEDVAAILALDVHALLIREQILTEPNAPARLRGMVGQYQHGDQAE